MEQPRDKPRGKLAVAAWYVRDVAEGIAKAIEQGRKTADVRRYILSLKDEASYWRRRCQNEQEENNRVNEVVAQMLERLEATDYALADAYARLAQLEAAAQVNGEIARKAFAVVEGSDAMATVLERIAERAHAALVKPCETVLERQAVNRDALFDIQAIASNAAVALRGDAT